MTENEHVHDPEVDLDPNEALEADYDPDGDILDEDAPGNDQAGEQCAFELVEGAQPVDLECGDEELPIAEAEIPEPGEDDQ